mgnify:CR=1 FL=1
MILKKSSSLFIDLIHFLLFLPSCEADGKIKFFLAASFFILQQKNRPIIYFFSIFCKLRKNFYFVILYTQNNFMGFLTPNPFFIMNKKKFHYYAMKKLVRLAPKTPLFSDYFIHPAKFINNTI